MVVIGSERIRAIWAEGVHDGGHRLPANMAHQLYLSYISLSAR